MEQERIVGLALRSHAIVLEAGIQFCIRRVPVLGIWWVANHGIHIERPPGIGASLLYRPVLAQRVGTARINVARTYATHDQIHSCQVVGVLFQFLCIIFHAVAVFNVPANALTNGNQQRAGTAGGVIYLNLLLVAVVLGHDF